MAQEVEEERRRGEEGCIFTRKGRDLQEYSHEEGRHCGEKQRENMSVPDIVRPTVKTNQRLVSCGESGRFPRRKSSLELF